MQPVIDPNAVPCPRCGKPLPDIEGDGVVVCRAAKCGRRVAIVWMPVEGRRFRSMSDAEQQVVNRKKWRG